MVSKKYEHGAGIALANRAAIATRNIKRFSDAGMRVIDPWAG